ncbi:MAG: hypothetical protein A3I63_08930 [Betaproteobacteria bacterium RIFCSPLOWO2_02_FULL_66_14]|nr:MAG: hypothetical protein A3I63_08930 [Betaproteobacteria bacterium RIFCSPLOWO2_02_FULL_66_14]
MKTLKSLTLAASTAAALLSGCIAVPVGPDGQLYVYPPGVVPAAVPAASVPPGAPAAAQSPAILHARLYPANDIATQTGMVAGTVTNMMTGKGRFQLNYKGELLAGEATRVDGDSRRGVASAYGQSGTFMSCEYQMNNPRQGAGTCTFSDGARYQVHVGS